MPITDKMWPHLLRLQPEIKAMECDAPSVVIKSAIKIEELTPDQIETAQIRVWLRGREIKFSPRLGLVNLRKLKEENQ